MAVNRIYCATGLRSGDDTTEVEGNLNTIDGQNLADKDMAIVIDQTTVYFYALDADLDPGSSSEPDTIVPINNGGEKAWVLQSLRINDLTLSDDIILVTDDITIGGVLQVGETSEFIGAVQIGDADGTGAALTIYSNTAGDHIVFSPIAKTLTLTDIQLVPTNVAAFTLDGKLTAGATEIEGSNFDIDGGDISAITISGSLTWSAAQDLNSQALTNVNIDSGSIDGVTIGAAAAPTVTDLGSVATCDINGGTIDGVTLFSVATGVSGSDVTLITGTSGTANQPVAFNADGDLIIAPSMDFNNINMTNVDIDSGAIDGVTIGAASAPTVTDLGSVATCDINGGSVDGITLGAASAVTFTSLTSSNLGQINYGDGKPDSNDQHRGSVFIEATVDQNTVGVNGCLVLSADGNWDDADKDAEATIGQLALATDSGTGADKTLMLQGFATDTGWAWTIGSQIFVSDSGALTQTAPSASGDFVQVVGYAIAATSIYFNPSPDYLEIA